MKPRRKLKVVTAGATLAACLAACPAIAASAAGSVCEPVGQSCFTLVSLTIDGVTAYRMAELASLYADYLARPVSQSDLVAIAQAITDKYRADGYFLSRAVVPPQGALPGHARLRVYEGYIGDLEVTGEAASAVEPLLAGLTAERPLKLADLERRITLADDMPGLRIRTSIEPVLDDPARHRLVVRATLDKWTGGVNLDNRGTRAIGPDQLYARVARNSALRAGDQLGLAVLTVPSDLGEFWYGELSYLATLSHGAQLRTAVSASRSQQGVTPLDNTVGSESQAFNLRFAYPLLRGRKHALWSAISLDARDVEQVYRSDGGYADNLRVVRASLQASRTDSTGSSYLFVQASRGLDALGASTSKGPGRSRFDADGQFWKLNGAVSHYRDIGRKAGIFLSADGQWAPEPLLLSEEFAPGGLPYGRAYDYAEISGDSGVAALAEVRVGWDPKLGPLSFFQTYAFVDGAKVWNRGSSFGYRSAHIASAGAGLRLTFKDRITVRLEAARPLGPAPWETGDKDWRAFFSLWAGY